MTLVQIIRTQPIPSKLFGLRGLKTDYKNDSAVNEYIDSASLVEQLHTCVVAVTCAYTKKVNNSYLRFHESFETSSSAQKATTFNSDNWNGKTRKISSKESQAFVSVQ